MFYIDSKTMKPDIDFFLSETREAMRKGIKLSRKTSNLYIKYISDCKALHKQVCMKMGIDNPNSTAQVCGFFEKELRNAIRSLVSLEHIPSYLSSDIYKILLDCSANRRSVLTARLLIEDYSGRSGFNGKDLCIYTDEVIWVCNRVFQNSIFRHVIVNGKFCTDKTVLQDLADDGHEAALLLLAYRRTKRLADTLSSLLSHSDSRDYIHPVVARAKTNRATMSSPALLSIPKSILWSVIAPRDGDSVLYSVDIKNQEPTIVANMLKSETLLSKLMDTDADYYSSLFYAIFKGMPSAEERKEFKMAWNAVTYHSTKVGLRRKCTLLDSDAIYDYYNSIKELKAYKAHNNKLAKANTQQVETYFGTILNADEPNKNRLKRVLSDIKVQGTGTDIMSLLLKHFYEESELRGLSDAIKFYFQRNDEFILEVHKSLDPQSVIAILRDIFEHKVDDWTPFRISITRLGECGTENISLSDDDIFVD